MNHTLFEDELIYLANIEPEKDAEIESKWSHDAKYLRMLSVEYACPLSAMQIKKRYECIEKKADESGTLFYLTIRKREDDRLVGFICISVFDWSHRAASLQLGLGDAADRGQGYGSRALKLMLRYAFGELNLRRISVKVPAYNTVALHIFEKAGFVVEVCRRQAIQRDGKCWDDMRLGLMQEEWKSQ